MVRRESRVRRAGPSQDAARPSRALRRHLPARPRPQRLAGVRRRVSAERRNRVDDRRPRRGVAATSRTDRLARIFWCLRNPARLIERIRQVGFVPAAPPPTAPAKRGIPVRWSFIIALVVVWNALFILGGFLPGKPPPEKPGVLVLVASFAVERSPAFQRWVLRPGRSVGEIRPSLRLIQLTTGLLVVIFAIVFMVA